MFSSTPTIIQIVWKIYEEAEYVQILDEKVEQLKAVNQTLLEDIDKKMSKIVQNFNEQVDEAKHQTVKITYKDSFVLKTK